MESTLPSTESENSQREAEGASSAAKVNIVIRLWLPDQRQTDPDPYERGTSPAGLLQLIEDVASVRKGKVQASEDQVHISSLASLADALVLSRLLQNGVLGYRRRSASAPVSVSIAIDLETKATRGGHASGTDTAANDETPQVSHESVSLLKLSRPAQVLLTHDCHRQLGPIGGLPLRSFPGRFGVYEYLWTEESKLEQLQFDPQLALELTTSPAAGRTLTYSNAESGRGVSTSRGEILAARNGQSRLGIPASFSRRAVVLGSSAAALILLLAGGIVLTHISDSRRPVPAVGTQFVTPKARPDADAAAPSPRPAPASIETPGAAPIAKVKVEPVKPKKQDRAAHISPAEVAPPSGDCADLATLEQLAEDNRQHGRFMDARRQFSHVLSCDKNNDKARIGLAKTIAAMGDRGSAN
jgi:hypothetical protein